MSHRHADPNSSEVFGSISNAPDYDHGSHTAIEMSATPHSPEVATDAHPADQLDPVHQGDHDGGVVPRADGGEDDNEDAESMESDYYYDDDGKMHTYYRPKKRLSNVSKRSRKSNQTDRFGARSNQLSARNSDAAGGGGEGSDGNQSDCGSLSSTMKNPSVANLPTNLRGIGKQIHKLSTEELLYISAMVGRKAHREAYSVLQYSGAAWYLPNIRKCHENEPHWGIDYNMQNGLVLFIGGKRMEVAVLSYVTRAALLVLFWFAVWNAIPKYLSERAGYIFDPCVTLLVCALVGGFLCRIFQIPPLVGCLWIGILWNNIGPEVGYLTKGIYKDVRTISGRMGITVVLLRAGYSISWKTVRPILPNVGALVFGAFGVESVVHAFFADYIFEYKNYTYAFLEGCLCSAPSAAVVVPGSLMLQSEGYSKTKGPLPLMLASVALETVLGVWVVSFILDLEFGSRSVGLSIALGPIQIIAGAAIGVALGFIFHFLVRLFLLEASRLPTGKYAETHLQNVRRNALIAFLIIAHATIFFAYYENLAGGGAVAVMMFACTVANWWTMDGDPEWVEMKKEMGAGLCDVWDLFVMPFLFSMTGSKIVAKKIFNKTFFPKALAVWAVSNVARMFAIAFTPAGLGFTWKEWVFMMPGYCAKATVQSALGAAALDFVNKKIAAADPTDLVTMASLQQKQEMAQNVYNVAMFYVMFSAPVAAVWVTKTGPRLLQKED